MDALRTVSLRTTSQRERADRRQVENSAGGFTFEVTDAQRLRRFLILGVDGGTYYASAPELAKSNADFLIELAERDHATLLNGVLEVSTAGLAHRQQATIFAYAIACSKGATKERAAALAAFDMVIRTGTHLFLFATYVEQFRGWGRALRRAVAGWYTEQPVERLTYQILKYRQREGWTHRDLLRLSHPEVTPDGHGVSGDASARRGVFNYATKGDISNAPQAIQAFEKAQADPTWAASYAGRIGVSWEMLPTEALNDPNVWEVLITRGNLPLGALVRQLPRLTRLGLFQKPYILGDVRRTLGSEEQIRKARIHPMSILLALKTYASGHSEKGTSTWAPNRHVIDALDKAFYLAFANVEPTGKRILQALDVSGSMTWHNIGGTSITPRGASAAMALVTMAAEDQADVVGFASESAWPNLSSLTTGADSVNPLSITPRQRLDDVERYMGTLRAGYTNAAAPMLYALEKDIAYDAFVVYTDNETWAGNIHPHQALRQYRERTGIPAKLVVVGMTATEFTIADPTDAGMLDVVGFDAGAPAVIADFIRG